MSTSSVEVICEEGEPEVDSATTTGVVAASTTSSMTFSLSPKSATCHVMTGETMAKESAKMMRIANFASETARIAVIIPKIIAVING